MQSTVDTVENVNDVKARFPASFSQILKMLLIWQITQVWSALISLQHTLCVQVRERDVPEPLLLLPSHLAFPLL